MQWFIMRNGQQAGPYTVEQIRAMLGTLELAPTDMAWREGMAGWSPISIVLATSPPPPPTAVPPPFTAAPPPFAAVATPTSAPISLGSKSRAIYIVLALIPVTGPLGVHNFYAGHYVRGGIQLALSVATLGFGYLPATVWALVDVFAVRQDGTGAAFN